MKIGLLSDTHGFLDNSIFEHFKDCDEVWHAGDLGDETLLQQLELFKPVRAVFGNIDDRTLQAKLPEDLWFTCEGLTIWMTHIGGVPPNYNTRIKKILKDKVPDIFICGHSHILRVMKDPQFKNMLYLNPGAAGNHGFHHMKTIMRFEITGKEIWKMEVIELGKRGAL
ncbi:MAG TPA: metallophosphoesterase family protein [Cyclobacteriaceae bacterium]|nr:metallophosphoesterase family protein [Cyclobacteriaceae bacterium]HRJ81077.1 metallophosphoesterase family protein [Cyclobacteriaceae bacterium]